MYMRLTRPVYDRVQYTMVLKCIQRKVLLEMTAFTLLLPISHLGVQYTSLAILLRTLRSADNPVKHTYPPITARLPGYLHLIPINRPHDFRNYTHSYNKIQTMSTTEKHPPTPQILSFPPSSPENPYNWPKSKKILIITLGTLIVLNTTLASSLPSLAQSALLAHFNVEEQIQAVLPNSIYLVGYVLGPTLWAPMSENFGRRGITMGTFVVYAGLMAGCAVAPGWGSFVVLRFLCGLYFSKKEKIKEIFL